ncbi:hypothetical protein KCP69_05630 [Salmonella enterica subsp. enterica]|nr:hypothetical protein KCP69_05630 [Salmonella enterica subsp. enterica]
MVHWGAGEFAAWRFNTLPVRIALKFCRYLVLLAWRAKQLLLEMQPRCRWIW